MKKSLFLVLCLASFSAFGSARIAHAEAPVQVALFNPLQVVPQADSVRGLRLNLAYGANYNVSGVDLGLFNQTDGEQRGLQLGLINSTFDVSGLQVGIVNRTDWLDGVQIGLINIHVEGERSFFPLVNWAF